MQAMQQERQVIHFAGMPTGCAIQIDRVIIWLVIKAIVLAIGGYRRIGPPWMQAHAV